MIAAILLTFTAVFAAGSPQFQAENAELAAYLAEAAENHPALKQRHAEWLSALERIPQATALDDPMFSYGHFLQSETQRFQMQVSQKFPWFGTLRLRGDKAAAEAEAVLTRFFAERDALFLGVRDAYYEYAFLSEQIGVFETQYEVLDLVESLVTTKLSLALATDDELLRTGIAKTELQDRLDSLMELRPAFSARLATAVGRPSHELLEWPETAPPPGETPDFDAVFQDVLQRNPSLHEFDHRLHALETQQELARKKGQPDITLSLGYTRTGRPRTNRPDRPFPATLNAASRTLSTIQGDMPFVPRNALIDAYSLRTYDEPISRPLKPKDNLVFNVAVNIPVWRQKIRAGIEEARLMQNAAEHEKQSLELELESATRMALYRMRDAARRHDLMRDSLLPQAEQTYESLLDKYAADAAGKTFLDIFESVQRLLDFQLEQARARAEWHRANAELGFLVGGADKTAP